MPTLKDEELTKQNFEIWFGDAIESQLRSEEEKRGRLVESVLVRVGG